MDKYQVPQKVNRHVLKAVYILSEEKNSASISEVINQVKYQMMNLVPVKDIDMMIQKSLRNLSEVGLITRKGTNRFGIENSVEPSTSTKANRAKPNQKLFKPSVSRKRGSRTLDPNSRVEYDSEDSLSGDDYNRLRKRLRTNSKKITHSGSEIDLPKSKRQPKNLPLKKSLRKADYDADSIESSCDTSTSMSSVLISAFLPSEITESMYLKSNDVFTPEPLPIIEFNGDEMLNNTALAESPIDSPEKETLEQQSGYLRNPNGEKSESSVVPLVTQETVISSDQFC